MNCVTGLAKESMSFTDAYAGAPVCAPSRCTLVGSYTCDYWFIMMNISDDRSSHWSLYCKGQWWNIE